MKLSLLLASGLLALAPFARAQTPEYPKMGADIFDPHSNGQALIDAAVAKAAAENKRVILDFGANWCIWCRRLHTTFETDPAVAKALHDGFIVVMIDVNTRNGVDRNKDVISKYDPALEGIPALAVLDSTGKELTIKDSGELEEGDHHSPAKITAFLARWAPPARS
jgi:thiol:disulfide interchange protein